MTALTENTPLEPASPQTRTQWGYWLNRLLVCNPFFLCSAALLLYAISKLSTDAAFLEDETQNLIFNFLALQVYEILVITASIALSRRQIWYDSALLVVVDHGLLFVPFMLICQGALIGSLFGAALSVIAALAAVLRMVAIARKYPQFNLPRRVITLAAAILAINGSVPHLLRHLVEDDYWIWEIPNLIAWYVVLPLLSMGADIFPRPKRYGGTHAERPWLPMLIYGLWLSGTGVHLWALGYICRIEFEMQFLGPALTVASWICWKRLRDFVPEPSAQLKKNIFSLTWLAPFVAFAEPYLFLALVAANGLVYGLLVMKGKTPEREMAKEFMFFLPALLLVGMPLEWAEILWPDVGRPQVIGLGVMLYALCNAVRLMHPLAGLLGAVAAASLVCTVTKTHSAQAFAQVACAFALVHSFRWKDDAKTWTWVRGSFAAGWLLAAYFWVGFGGSMAQVWTSAVAAAVLVVWVAVLLLRGQMHNLPAACAAVMIALHPTARWLWERSSVGLLALVASYALLAVGFVIALRRQTLKLLLKER